MELSDSPIYHLGSKSNTSPVTLNFPALSEDHPALFAPLFLCVCLHLTLRGEGKGWTSGQKKIGLFTFGFFFFRKGLSVQNPVCSETLCVDQAILELTEICLPLIPKCRD